MSSVYGKNFKITIFGQSHSAGIGAVIDGLPPGKKIDLEELQNFLARRAPGKNNYSTKRREADAPEILSGLVNGVTCGAPFAAFIRNTDARSSDYNEIADIPRPAQADFTAHVKFGGAQDVRGGGHFSGRLTAPLCIAGGIFIQLLRAEGIEIAAHISKIGDKADTAFDLAKVSKADFDLLKKNEFPVMDEEAGKRMIALIKAMGAKGDSVGGVVECAALGLPAGLGEPMFEGVENAIASAVFAIPAVKGIEFGNGFASSQLTGSENNDAFFTDGERIYTDTNNAGGILGGITSGMPLVFRAAFKPTPSISIEQNSVSLSKMENTVLRIKGRHDPCIVPRAVPCVEAAAAIAIYDALLDNKRFKGEN